jgi:5-bromo-4-chloroindolyl phosphate hydrolysis protein
MIIGIVIGLFVISTVATLYFKNRATDTHPLPQQMNPGQARGLRQRDAVVFAQTYQQVKSAVDQLAELMMAHAETRQLAEETGLLKISRGILTELKKEPEELPLVDEYAYTHLPNAVRLMQGYHEIALHTVLTDEDEQRLAESRQTLTALAPTFKAAYEALVANDRTAVDDEVYFAKMTNKN